MFFGLGPVEEKITQQYVTGRISLEMFLEIKRLIQSTENILSYLKDSEAANKVLDTFSTRLVKILNGI